MRLVEICVDGDLEATMYSAQADLADAYIAAGQAAEARFIAEDLVAREPWERANVERFRRALELAGEADPDGMIAERLSGESPFMSTDLSLRTDDLPPYTPPPDPDSIEGVLAQSSLGTIASDPILEFDDAPASAKKGGESKHFELSAHTIDLGSILGDLEEPPPTVRGNAESVEVDLSIVLDDIKKPGKSSATPAPDIDDVFATMRADATKSASSDPSEAAYRRGLELRAAGEVDEAIPALEAASRAPRLRFASAALLGRIYSDRNEIEKAIEWYERAAEAPAPTPDEGQSLLYDLAVALETSGEVARALAIFMELQAEAGRYRDVPARVSRLTKAQARG
jgi:hypothetical protein